MPKSPQIPPESCRAIEVVAFASVQMLDVNRPLQVFATANEIAIGHGEACPYATRIVATDALVTTSAGVEIVTSALPAADAPPDTLLVAGGAGVEAARCLLLDSRLPVKRIAQRYGFGSEETLRRSFLRQLAVTPQDYRARFSA